MSIHHSALAEAITWARAGVEILQLEKFTPALLKAYRDTRQSHGLRPLLAAAGGINADNAADYALGVHTLVSSWPYQARPKDVQVRFPPRSH